MPWSPESASSRWHAAPSCCPSFSGLLGAVLEVAGEIGHRRCSLQA